MIPFPGRPEFERFGSKMRSGLLLIVEIANVHEGDFAYAQRIVDAAVQTGADAVKCQIYVPEERGVQGTADHIEYARLSFTYQQWETLTDIVRRAGLWLLADVYGPQGLEWAERCEVSGYKIHAADIVNIPFVRQVAALHKPVLLSTGGANLTEIAAAASAILRTGNPSLGLIHGFQAFPTSAAESNLRRIQSLKQQWGLPVGFASHIDGDSEWARWLPVLAVSAGATIIEEHLTLDRSRRLDDDHSALNPSEFAELAGRLKALEEIVGDGRWLPTIAERKYRSKFQKSLVAAADIAGGTTVELEFVSYGPFDTDVHAARLETVMGKRARTRISRGEIVTFDKLDLKVVVLVAVCTRSERLPQKALLRLHGQTTLEHLLDRLKYVTLAQEVIVATSVHPDDDIIGTLAAGKRVRCFRGSEDDVLGRFIGAADEARADVVIRVTADNILTDPWYIDRAVRHHLSRNMDYTRIEGLPDGMCADVFLVETMKTAHALGQSTDNSEYMSWFLNRPEFFRVTSFPCAGAHRRPEVRLTLDFQEDFEVLQQVSDHLYQPGAMFDTDAIIDFCDTHPDVLNINQEAKLLDRNIPETQERLGIDLRWPGIR